MPTLSCKYVEPDNSLVKDYCLLETSTADLYALVSFSSCFSESKTPYSAIPALVAERLYFRFEADNPLALLLVMKFPYKSF